VFPWDQAAQTLNLVVRRQSNHSIQQSVKLLLMNSGAPTNLGEAYIWFEDEQSVGFEIGFVLRNSFWRQCGCIDGRQRPEVGQYFGNAGPGEVGRSKKENS